MENLLVVRNLSKIYNTGKGISNINFELNKGTILGVIGLNGAGKTTLLHCITGFLRPDEGQIEYTFNGEQFNEATPALLDNLGIVSSEYGYPAHFTAKIISHIMSSTYRSWDKNKFFEVLEIWI